MISEMSEYPENPGELPVLKLRNRSDGGDGPLRKGSSGELVEQLQMMLRDLGYDIGDPSVDGKFGDLTEKAVRQFQEEHKDWEGNLLKVDGLVGPKTSDAFNRMFVGIWYDKYKTPEEITKDTLYITVTRNALSAEVSLKSNKDTKKVKVIVEDRGFDWHSVDRTFQGRKVSA
ncbi:MAG: peptidoglycan-binding domain-containing protein [Candidatus Methanoperedens sp.]|nr:peptidoglycan-binding domain-containing protein [Candidatus Methanoperedens sp.]